MDPEQAAGLLGGTAVGRGVGSGDAAVAAHEAAEDIDPSGSPGSGCGRWPG
jgi:hypothetical protein